MHCGGRFRICGNNVAHPGRNHHLRCEYRNDCYGPNCGPRYVRRRQHHIHDNHILSIRRYRSISRPVCAVLQTKNEIVNMAALAMRNFNLSLGWLNNEIIAFVVNLSGRRGLGEKDHIFLSGTFRTVRISNLAKLTMNFNQILLYFNNYCLYLTIFIYICEKFRVKSWRYDSDGI